MISEKEKIGKRLREFGEGKFDSIAEFARALGMAPQNLNSYLSGLFTPGNKMQARLRDLGCDIEWLMTGIHRDAAYAARFASQSGTRAKSASEPGLIYGEPMMGWAKFEGRVVANPAGKEYWDTNDIPDSAGVPYRRGNFFCLEVESNSLMTAEPIPILPGDICIFESNKQPKSGDIVAVHLKNNRRMVKILKHVSSNEIELASANKYQNYPSIKIKKTEIASYGVFKSKMQLSDEEKKFFGIK